MIVPPHQRSLFAAEAKAGGLEVIDMQTGEHKKEDYLAVNPYGQVPAFKDGDVKIGQSNAILRYLAIKYKPDTYPVTDPDKCAKIDFAIDSLVDYVYSKHMTTVYVVLGASPAAPHRNRLALPTSKLAALSTHDHAQASLGHRRTRPLRTRLTSRRARSGWRRLSAPASSAAATRPRLRTTRRFRSSTLQSSPP